MYDAHTRAKCRTGYLGQADQLDPAPALGGSLRLSGEKDNHPQTITNHDEGYREADRHSDGDSLSEEMTEKQGLEGQEEARPAEGHVRQRNPKGRRPHGWKEPRVLTELKGLLRGWRRRAGEWGPQWGAGPAQPKLRV